ncbi:MAG: hypothetical protein HC922_10240 [Leptolyngbyaceae cyanobacterium SM2_3_12]|nr:hypothetical protein [Leptolyngbyaceae cyanobacterium SM2_3_12]
MEPESPKAVEELIEEPVYVYGICYPPQEGLTLPLGLEQATRLVVVEDIAAIVESGLSLGEMLPDDPRLLSAVLSHDRVICDLFQHMPLLPMRFGTQLASLDQLQHHLGRHALDYRTKLAALGDKAEYQLKLTPQAIDLGPLPTDLKGREYF